MELFDFGLIVLGPLSRVGKHSRQTVNRLPFPCRHLRWANLVRGRNLLRRLVSTQRLERHGGLEFVRK